MDIKFLKGVGEKRAEAFSKIGINTLDDFLSFIPRTYISRINIRELNNHLDENILVSGKIIDVVYPRKSNHPLQLILKDKTGVLDIPVFGTSEFRSKQFRLNETFLFWIKAVKENFSSVPKISYRDHLKINEYDPLETDFLKYKYLPLYELSGILKKSWIRPLLLSKIIFNAFATLLKSNPHSIEETLPEEILKENNFINRIKAHFQCLCKHFHRYQYGKSQKTYGVPNYPIQYLRLILNIIFQSSNMHYLARLFVYM